MATFHVGFQEFPLLEGIRRKRVLSKTTNKSTWREEEKHGGWGGPGERNVQHLARKRSNEIRLPCATEKEEQAFLRQDSQIQERPNLIHCSHLCPDNCKETKGSRNYLCHCWLFLPSRGNSSLLKLLRWFSGEREIE